MSQRKLKIVFLDYVLELDKPGRTGLSDIVWDMASELVELGHEVHVVAPYSQRIAPDQRVIIHTIKVPPTGYRWFVGHLWICKRMSDLAYKLNADIVHAPESISIAVYNLLYPKAKSRQVITIPGNIFHKLRTKNGNPYPFFFTECLKWAARKSATSNNIVIATSQEMKEAWEETGSPPALTPLIPLGTNPARFYHVPNAREKLGIDKDCTLLLYVGRFSSEKAILELVQTIGEAKDTLSSSRVKIFLIGKGPLTEQVIEKVKTLALEEIVTIKNWVAQEDLPVWYSAADALLLPSYAEGFARVLPESMICGTPVIGSRITGTEDVVIPGQTGFLFEPGNFNELRAILEKVATDPTCLRNLRSTTKFYAETNLSWPSIVRKINTEVYQKSEVVNKTLKEVNSNA